MSLHMSEDRRPSPKHSQMNKVTVCLIFSHRLYRKDVHSFQVWKEKMMQIVLNLHFFPLMASLRQLIQLQKEIQLNWSLWKKNSPRLCRTVTSVNTFLMSLWSQLLVSSLNKYNMTLGKSCPLYWKKEDKAGCASSCDWVPLWFSHSHSWLVTSGTSFIYSLCSLLSSGLKYTLF